MKWINTNHALPEDDEVVLALTTGGDYIVLSVGVVFDRKYWFEPQTDYQTCNADIVCWSRLPEVTDLTDDGECSFNQIRDI